MTAVKRAVKKRRGLRQEQRELASAMRAEGKTWVEIATVLRDRYGVNARTALRLAHGWSQPEAADQWTRRWPDDPKTLKNISYWENWPSSSGREPSLPVLARLAELYQCSVADLLADGPDYRHLDPRYGALERATPMPPLAELHTQLDSMLDRLAEANVERVASIGLLWAQRLRPEHHAYAVLMTVSAGMALAAAAYQAMDGGPDLRQHDGPDSRQHDGEERSERTGGDGLAAPCWPLGIWRMRYREAGTSMEHYVVIREHRGRLLGQGLPHVSRRRVRLDLQVEGRLVTGSWIEHGDCTTYRTLQLTLSPNRHSMHGQWLGFDAAQRIATGDWELHYLKATVSGRSLRLYRGTAA